MENSRMGDIVTTGKSIYADGPESSPTQPDKVRIRNELLPLIETKIEGAVAGAVRMPTWPALASVAGTRVGQPAEVPKTDTGTHTDPVVGGSVANAGQYRWSGSPAGWQWVSAIYDPEADIAQVKDAADIPGQTGRSLRVLDARGRATPRGTWYNGGTFTWWARGVLVTRAVIEPGDVTFYPAEISATATKFRLQGWKRLATDADYEPGLGLADVATFDQTFLIADVIDVPGRANAQAAVIPLDGHPAMDAGYIYWFKLTPLTAANAVTTTGMANGKPVSGSEPTYVRGWSSAGGGGFALPAAETIAFTFRERAKVEPVATASFIGDERVVTKSDVQKVWPSTAGAVTSVLLPEMVIERDNAPVKIPQSLVTCASPGSVAASDVRNLQYQNMQQLPYQHISGWTVRRVSDNALLTEGVDYRIDADFAGITGLQNVAGYDVTISYTGHRSRYEVIHADPSTGALASATGALRGADVAEYMPSVPLGRIPIAALHVTNKNGVTIVPIHRYRDGVRIGDEARHHAIVRYAQAMSPRLMRMLRSSQTIRLGLVGTSIQAQGGQPSSEWNTVNGATRDVLNGYMAAGRIASDTIGSIALYDHGDGLGQFHTHTGWAWTFKDALEAAYGSLIEIRNHAVGGSNVGTAEPGANAPQKRAAIIADQCDHILFDPGTNDQDNDSFEAQTIAAIQWMKTSGAEVTVITPPLPNRYGRLNSYDQWLSLSDQAARAARFAGAAVLPLHHYINPSDMGAMGLGPNSLGVAGVINHPGPTELAFIGRLLSKLYL